MYIQVNDLSEATWMASWYILLAASKKNCGTCCPVMYRCRPVTGVCVQCAKVGPVVPAVFGCRVNLLHTIMCFCYESV